MYAPFVVSLYRVQCVVSHVRKADMDKTVQRSVSVTTTAFVCRPPESACAALDTQENGKSNFFQCSVIIYSVFTHLLFELFRATWLPI